MPSCYFYAVGSDHEAVLRALLDLGGCDVYEDSSRPEQELRSFSSLREIEEAYGITDWRAPRIGPIQLQLRAHGSFDGPVETRIELAPGSSNGATFRFDARGWGLIQVSLESPTPRALPKSSTKHNSPQRAQNWAEVCSELGDPERWNWPVITSFSGRLNRRIRKLAVAKHGTWSMLPSAAALAANGIHLGS